MVQSADLRRVSEIELEVRKVSKHEWVGFGGCGSDVRTSLSTLEEALRGLEVADQGETVASRKSVETALSVLVKESRRPAVSFVLSFCTGVSTPKLLDHVPG